jgi:prepilin-type N-terminal cleavage/methylation domain-containing protein
MKKGFTIIELIIAIGAAGIIATAMVSMLLTYSSSYIKKSKDHRDYFYSMEALMFIQNEVNVAKSVSAENNIIELYYLDGTIKKIIKLNNHNNIVIIHMKNNAAVASNNIVTDISYFEVLQKNNLIYISINRKNGEKYEKCISIKTTI